MPTWFRISRKGKTILSFKTDDRLLRISHKGKNVLKITATQNDVDRAVKGGIAAAAITVLSGGTALPVIGMAFAEGAASVTAGHVASQKIKDPVIRSIVDNSVSMLTTGTIRGTITSNMVKKAVATSTAGAITAGLTNKPEHVAIMSSIVGGGSTKQNIGSFGSAYVSRKITKYMKPGVGSTLIGAAVSTGTNKIVDEINFRSPIKPVYDQPIGPPMRPVYDRPIGPSMRPVYDQPIGPPIGRVYDQPIGPPNKRTDINVLSQHKGYSDVYVDTTTGLPIGQFDDGHNRLTLDSSNGSVGYRHLEQFGDSNTRMGMSGIVSINGTNVGAVTREGNMTKECGVGIDTNAGWDNEAYTYCKYTESVPAKDTSRRYAQTKIDDYRQDYNIPIIGKIGSMRQSTTATAKSVTVTIRVGMNANGVTTVVPVGAGSKLAYKAGVRSIYALGNKVVIRSAAAMSIP